MKDSVKRSIVFIIFGAFLVYLVYLIIKWEPITTSEYSNMNIPMYILLIALCIYMLVFYSIYPIYIKFSRSTALVIWLASIILSQTMLANDWLSHIYIWDIFSVIWVLILILFPTNIITTDKVKKSKAKKNEIIIEV